MKRQDINQQINEEILSGGGRTRALGTRSVLHNLADSTLNTSDHPQFTETPLASGSSNTYTAAYSEPITGYESGYLYKIDFGTANTGASTLNINSLGQKIIRRSNGSDLEAGDLEGVVLLAYTGSVFQLVGGTSMSSGDLVHRTGDETIDGVKTFEEILVLPDADPEDDNEAARKKYVDDSRELAESYADSITGSLSASVDNALSGKENISNKAQNFDTVNHTLYPTIQAVVSWWTSVRQSAQTISALWTFSADIVTANIRSTTNLVISRFQNVTNAVNFLTFFNASNNNYPRISAENSSGTNVGIELVNKGTGKIRLQGTYYDGADSAEKVVTMLGNELNIDYSIVNGSVLPDIGDSNGIRLDDDENWEVVFYNFETCDREGPKGAISSDSDYWYYAIEDNTWIRINLTALAYSEGQKLIIVDAQNGHDSVALTGSFVHRYATADAAIAALTDGDAIWFMPGVYTASANLWAVNNLSVRFIDCTYNTSVAIASPGADASLTISAYGSVVNQTEANGNFIRVNHADSSLQICGGTWNDAKTSTSGLGLLRVGDQAVRVRLKDMVMNGATPLFLSGDISVPLGVDFEAIDCTFNKTANGTSGWGVVNNTIRRCTKAVFDRCRFAGEVYHMATNGQQYGGIINIGNFSDHPSEVLFRNCQFNASGDYSSATVESYEIGVIVTETNNVIRFEGVNVFDTQDEYIPSICVQDVTSATDTISLVGAGEVRSKHPVVTMGTAAYVWHNIPLLNETGIRDYTKLANATTSSEELYDIDFTVEEDFVYIIELAGNCQASSSGAIELELDGSPLLGTSVPVVNAPFTVQLEVYSSEGYLHFIARITMGNTGSNFSSVSTIVETGLTSGSSINIAFNALTDIVGGVVLRKRLVLKENKI